MAEISLLLGQKKKEKKKKQINRRRTKRSLNKKETRNTTKLLETAHAVIAGFPGNKLTQKDNADSGVQFITPAGPRQSLLLAKDHNQHL